MPLRALGLAGLRTAGVAIAPRGAGPFPRDSTRLEASSQRGVLVPTEAYYAVQWCGHELSNFEWLREFAPGRATGGARRQRVTPRNQVSLISNTTWCRWGNVTIIISSDYFIRSRTDEYDLATIRNRRVRGARAAAIGERRRGRASAPRCNSTSPRPKTGEPERSPGHVRSAPARQRLPVIGIARRGSGVRRRSAPEPPTFGPRASDVARPHSHRRRSAPQSPTSLGPTVADVARPHSHRRRSAPQPLTALGPQPPTALGPQPPTALGPAPGAAQPLYGAAASARRPVSASSTCAGWSSALATLRQCFFTTPSGPIQTVERMTPSVFLP